MSDALELRWQIDDTVLGGYPHVYNREFLDFSRGWRFQDGLFEDYPFIYSRTFQDFPRAGWSICDDVFESYPHIYFRELIPPYVPAPPLPCPEIVLKTLNVPGRYVGAETDVTVTLGLRDIVDGDDLIFHLYRAGAVYYEGTAILSDGVETYTHTIPTSAFVGLAVGSLLVRVQLLRDSETKDDVSVNYAVVAAPTVVFDNLLPTEIQLPITTPLTITSRWQVAGDGINRIQGSATIGEGLHSTVIDLSSQTFYANFANVTSIAPGSHSIAINLTITSDRYGIATVSASSENVLTILPPIPEPEITNVSLDGTGRYVGMAIAVTVSVGLDNIRDGDSITIRLRQGGSVFYEHHGDLSAGATTHIRTIATSVFDGLAVGSYTVQVILVRDYATRDESLATYRIVDLPTVQLLYVSPNTIQLPMAQAENINVTMQVFGAGVLILM